MLPLLNRLPNLAQLASDFSYMNQAVPPLIGAQLLLQNYYQVAACLDLFQTFFLSEVEEYHKRITKVEKLDAILDGLYFTLTTYCKFFPIIQNQDFNFQIATINTNLYLVNKQEYRYGLYNRITLDNPIDSIKKQSKVIRDNFENDPSIKNLKYYFFDFIIICLDTYSKLVGIEWQDDMLEYASVFTNFERAFRFVHQANMAKFMPKSKVNKTIEHYKLKGIKTTAQETKVTGLWQITRLSDGKTLKPYDWQASDLTQFI